MPTEFSAVGTRRVVFGGHQTVTRVERCRHRRAKVNISQPHHQITGIKDGFVDLVDIFQIVNPADKLQITRAPWRVAAHGGHVFSIAF